MSHTSANVGQPPLVTATHPEPSAATSRNPVHIAFAEVANFRRLRSVRLDFDPKTTVFVGANNSGKTTAIAALRLFLRDQNRFSAYDISASSWPALDNLGKAWDKLAPNLAPGTGDEGDDTRAEAWEQELETLKQAMPTLDIWLRAEAGDFHRVSHLIPNLTWTGGLVGVRLRLEPASDVEELRTLALAYRQARSLVLDEKAAESPAKDVTWPTDLLDYWKHHPQALRRHVVAYKLDPAQISAVDEQGQAQPQVLDHGAEPFDSYPLKDIVRVDVVPAQRGLGSEEAEGIGDRDDYRPGLFSQQLIKFTERFSDTGLLETEQQRALLLTLAKSQSDLDDALNGVLEGHIQKVRTLGYPGLNDPQNMVFRSRVRPRDALNHSTAVQYRFTDNETRSQHLPEHAIGLGYQNLLSLSFRLLSFENERVQPAADPKTGLAPAPAPVHLILLEEPEAHLHVQVQRVFVRKAYALVKPSQAGLSSQLVMSTHSSHMAHALSFQHLRFFRRMAAEDASALPTSVVLGLGDVFGKDDKTRRFVERYLQLQHSDLLFADAAIFIEGTAEKMLVPSFVERVQPALADCYLSYLVVGGSHAHRWRPLLERLGLTSLIITDLDPKTVSRTTNEEGKKIVKKRKACVDTSVEQITANHTLSNWLPAKEKITALLDVDADGKVATLGTWTDAKVRVAYQIPGDGTKACASSFEDALLLENRDWFKALPDVTEGPLGHMRKISAKPSSDSELAQAAHEKLSSNFDKGAFALDLLFTLSSANPDSDGVSFQCPRYIREGIEWLNRELSAEVAGEGA